MRRKKPLPPIERLREVFTYDPVSGEVTRKLKTGRRDALGPVTTLSGTGYLQAGLDGHCILLHRVAFALYYGRWPEGEVDHEDGDGFNNSMLNLRECTRLENSQNVTRHSDNRAGALGVTLLKTGRFHARIHHKGRTRSLGTHRCPTAAHFAYLKAKRELHTFNPVPRAN